MSIQLTKQEELALNLKGSLVKQVAGLDSQPFMSYHDPITGREHTHLPADAVSLRFYLQKGLMMGPASSELKMKWEASALERNATLDKLREQRLWEKKIEQKDDKDARIAELETQLEEAHNNRLGIQGKLL